MSWFTDIGIDERWIAGDQTNLGFGGQGPQTAPPPAAATPDTATSGTGTGHSIFSGWQSPAMTGPQNGDYQGWFNSLLQGRPFNQQTLLELEPLLNQHGIQLTPPNANGERTKINVPGQGWVRVGFGEGTPQWIVQGDSNNASGTSPNLPTGPAPVPQAGINAQNAAQLGAFSAPTITGPDPLTLASITQPANVTAQQIQAQQAAGPDRLTLGQITRPADVQAGQIANNQIAMPGTITGSNIQGPDALTARNLNDPSGFQGVSDADLLADKSYPWRKAQQLGALEAGAAAKGLLHTGGTLQAEQELAGNIASQEYGNVYARKLGEYQNALTNQANVTGQNNQAQAQAYGLTNQYQQQAALANQQNAYNVQAANIANQMQGGQFNASLAQNQQAQNIANQLQAGQFNAGLDYNTQAANIANSLAAYQAYQGLNQANQQFNAGQGNQAQAQNAANALNAGQFNAGMNFNTQQQNIANQLAGYNSYQGLNQAAKTGNAGNALGAYQASSNNALGLGQLGLGYQNSANNYALGLGNLGVSQGQLGLAAQGQNYNQGFNTWNANQLWTQQGWQNQYDLAKLGMPPRPGE